MTANLRYLFVALLLLGISGCGAEPAAMSTDEPLLAKAPTLPPIVFTDGSERETMLVDAGTPVRHGPIVLGTPVLVETEVACPISPKCDQSLPAVATDATLVVSRESHAAVLDGNFQLADVLQQLLDQDGAASETPDELIERLFDTYNVPPFVRFKDTFAPHCAPINGTPMSCPRTGEGALAAGIKPGDFRPVALFNRFDLARVDGQHCGEYRIVYWSRNLPSVQGTIIFEGQLPNPNPACGIESCRPVAEFWRSLDGLDEVTLGKRLREFFFNGINGFRPVIHINNYGLGARGLGRYGGSGGQVRVNTLSLQPRAPWMLRELQLGTAASPKGPKLFFRPVTDKNNPFGDWFQAGASGFGADFVKNQVATLAAETLSGIGMSIPDQYNAGQSISQNLAAPDNYAAEPLDPAFKAAIAAAIPKGSSLSVTDIRNRATTQSCGGCHNISNNVSLGGNLTWPPSLGFFHVGENGELSTALTCAFLPRRQAVLTGFLRNCGSPPPSRAPFGCNSFGALGRVPQIPGGVVQGPHGGGDATLGGSVVH